MSLEQKDAAMESPPPLADDPFVAAAQLQVMAAAAESPLVWHTIVPPGKETQR